MHTNYWINWITASSSLKTNLLHWHWLMQITPQTIWQSSYELTYNMWTYNDIINSGLWCFVSCLILQRQTFLPKDNWNSIKHIQVYSFFKLSCQFPKWEKRAEKGKFKLVSRKHWPWCELVRNDAEIFRLWFELQLHTMVNKSQGGFFLFTDTFRSLKLDVCRVCSVKTDRSGRGHI